MAKPKSYRLRKRPQAYDSTLKEWVQQQPEVILPLILPNAVYKETLDVERIKPTMRVDRVYKIMYRAGTSCSYVSAIASNARGSTAS